MDYYLSEQQIEELVNFDQYEDLSDLIEEEQEFNMNEYLNSNIDYWFNELSYRNCQRPTSPERTSWNVEESRFPLH